MRRNSFAVALAGISIALVAMGASAALFEAPNVVSVTPAWSSSQAQPGGEVVLALVLDIADGYRVDPDAAMRTRG